LFDKKCSFLNLKPNRVGNSENMSSFRIQIHLIGIRRIFFPRFKNQMNQRENRLGNTFFFAADRFFYFREDRFPPLKTPNSSRIALFLVVNHNNKKLSKTNEVMNGSEE
jgi:hypothetical protein